MLVRSGREASDWLHESISEDWSIVSIQMKIHKRMLVVGRDTPSHHPKALGILPERRRDPKLFFKRRYKNQKSCR